LLRFGTSFLVYIADGGPVTDLSDQNHRFCLTWLNTSTQLYTSSQLNTFTQLNASKDKNNNNHKKQQQQPKNNNNHKQQQQPQKTTELPACFFPTPKFGSIRLEQ